MGQADGRTPDPVDVLVTTLRHDPAVLFITGAGVSADSALPTYRGVGGLYEDTPVAEGVSIEEALSGAMFQARPDITWKYLRQVEEACRGAGPNDAHRVIAWLQRQLTRVVVLTQNVDGLHQAAGTTDVIAIHGDVHQLRCTVCAWRDAVTSYAHLPPLPACPACGQVVRPEVVLFGEMLPVQATRRLHEELARGFDVVVSVGTTSAFPYIAEPVLRAGRWNASTFEINPGTTDVSHAVRHRIRRGAAEVLREVKAKLQAPRPQP